jgi:hypothetical protein
MLLAGNLVTQRLSGRYSRIWRDNVRSGQSIKREPGSDDVTCAFHVELAWLLASMDRDHSAHGILRRVGDNAS